jgi:hypothetical protein
VAIRDDLDGGLDAVISSLWMRKMWKEDGRWKRMDVLINESGGWQLRLWMIHKLASSCWMQVGGMIGRW